MGGEARAGSAADRARHPAETEGVPPRVDQAYTAVPSTCSDFRIQQTFDGSGDSGLAPVCRLSDEIGGLTNVECAG